MSTKAQLDHPWGNPIFLGYPSSLDMRNTAENHVHFRWPQNINPTRYTVMVESLDVSGPTYRSIGKLSHNPNAREGTLKLPEVHFGWHSRIGVVPDVNSLPSFEGELSRGSTYDVPAVTKNGTFRLRRHGAIGLGY